MDELLAQLKIVRHHLTGSLGALSRPAPSFDERIRALSPGNATPSQPQPSPRTISGPIPDLPDRRDPPWHSSRPPPPPDDSTGEHVRRAVERARRLAFPAAALALLVLSAGIWRTTRRHPPPAPQPAAAADPAAAVLPAPDPEMTIVAVTSVPSGAEVIDEEGRTLGNTPLEVPVASGKPLRLVLQRNGYAPFKLTRKSVSGAHVALNATLKKDARASAPSGPKRSGGYREDPY